MKLQVSLSSWRQNILSHHFLFSFDSPAPVSCWLEENYLVYSLEDVRFLICWVWEHKFLGCCFDFFSFIGIPQIDPRFQTLWRDFLTPLLAIAQYQTWTCFHRWRAFIRSRLLASFRHGVLLSNRIRIVRKKVAKKATSIEKFIILNKHRRWSHSPLEKLPSVRMSASGFLVFTYLTWILGSKLILSNNQEQPCGFWTRVSLLDFVLWWSSWTLPRCLQKCTTEILCGKNAWWRAHNPLHSIDQPSCLLLTLQVLVMEWRASVSCMLVCFGWTLLLVERRNSITTAQRSRASNPSIRNPASREMTSDSLQLCETEVCFLHIQLTGTNVLLRKKKKHKTPP